MSEKDETLIIDESVDSTGKAILIAKQGDVSGMFPRSATPEKIREGLKKTKIEDDPDLTRHLSGTVDK